MRRRETTVGQRMSEGQGSPSAPAICVGMRGDHELCGSLSGGLRSVATGADDEQGQTKILRLHDAQRLSSAAAGGGPLEGRVRRHWGSTRDACGLGDVL
jgi:hypothetical protein